MILDVRRLKKYFAGRIVFDDVNCTIDACEVLIMRCGLAVEFGTQRLFKEPREPYTRELIEAAGL